jgi:hypothetical protein
MFFAHTSSWAVEEIAPAPRQYSKSWFRDRSRPMTIFLFFPRLLRILKWGLLFDEKRGLTTTGHFPSNGRTRAGNLSPALSYVHTPLTLLNSRFHLSAFHVTTPNSYNRWHLLSFGSYLYRSSGICFSGISQSFC